MDFTIYNGDLPNTFFWGDELGDIYYVGDAPSPLAR